MSFADTNADPDADADTNPNTDTDTDPNSNTDASVTNPNNSTAYSDNHTFRYPVGDANSQPGAGHPTTQSLNPDASPDR